MSMRVSRSSCFTKSALRQTLLFCRKILTIPSLVKNPTYEPFLEPGKTVNGETGNSSRLLLVSNGSGYVLVYELEVYLVEGTQ